MSEVVAYRPDHIQLGKFAIWRPLYGVFEIGCIEPFVSNRVLDETTEHHLRIGVVGLDSETVPQRAL